MNKTETEKRTGLKNHRVNMIKNKNELDSYSLDGFFSTNQIEIQYSI